MEDPDHIEGLMKESSTTDFLKAVLDKLDDLSINSPEELLLLDKFIYKGNNIAKDSKMGLLTPQLQEKFIQHMKNMKIDPGNFLNMLNPYEHGPGPYTTRPKADVTLNSTSAHTTAIQDNTHTAFNVVAESNQEPPTIMPSSDKSYRSYGNAQRPVEQGSMTPKNIRTNSSSSSSSSSDSEERRSSSNKLQDMSQFSAKGGMNKITGRLPARYRLKITKPKTTRAIRLHNMANELKKLNSWK